ncbi:ricin B lectin domain-containing protein [Mycena haematopus]|nr:ricin B lectin domain-containing protein [Mycena haematopus]
MFSLTCFALLAFTLSAAARSHGMQSRAAAAFIAGQLASGDSTRDAGFCLTAESNEDGAAVAIGLCGDLNPSFPNGNTTWVVPVAPLTGSIATFSGEKCLDVTNGNAVNGQTLQIWTCTPGNTNQMFLVSNSANNAQIQWLGTDFCVDLTGGNTTPGTPIQIWECAVPANSNLNQEWVISSPN